MAKISGIYYIKNIINEKMYIGQSIDIKQRWREHRSDLRNNSHLNKHLQSAWNKYSENNFVFEILEQEIPEDKLDEKEIYYISLYNSNNRKFGYNIDNGGNGKGKVSEETKIKLRNIISKKYKNDKNYIEKCKNANKRKGLPIYQIDFSGNIVTEWCSVSEASRNGFDKKTILQCIHKKRKHHKDYIWIRVCDYDVNTFNINDYINFNDPKKVYQYDLCGNLIAEYPSAKYVGKEFEPKDIYAVCNHEKNRRCIHRNYFWSYKKLSKEQVLNIINNRYKRTPDK